MQPVPVNAFRTYHSTRVPFIVFRTFPAFLIALLPGNNYRCSFDQITGIKKGVSEKIAGRELISAA